MVASILTFCFAPLRVCLLALGGLSISWAVYTFECMRVEGLIDASAQHLLSGEKYNSAQLDRLRNRLNATSTYVQSGAALAGVVIIRLQIFESRIGLEDLESLASKRTEVANSLRLAFRVIPSSSFLWLTEYWLRAADPSADQREQSISMSYSTGPCEGWIAAIRNPIAVPNLPSLQKDLAARVLDEFAGLVRSGLYTSAAESIASADREVRFRLLERITLLGESTRRNFARALDARGVDDVSVPGVDRRHDRPF